MIRSLHILLISSLAITSCAKLGIGGEKEKEDQPFGPTGIPPQLRGRNSGTAVTPGGNVKMSPMRPAITPDEEIVFTDPDNPDANLPELSSLLAIEKKGPWEESETIARQRASREGKPLLIWFTDSAPSGSAMSKALDTELLSTGDFEKWAADKLVRLRVDSNFYQKSDDLSLDEQTDRNLRRRDYVTELKKRYKVLGQPTLLMLNPSGEVIGRYRGYKRGDAAYTWGLLKQGEVAAMTAYSSWRKDLEKKGYREWQDRKGRKVFAKLINYHQGDLIFMEPDGTRSKTKEDRLSDEDRGWISQQKMLRGIQ